MPEVSKVSKNDYSVQSNWSHCAGTVQSRG